VAAPSIGVFPEIVHDQENGILFRVGDPEDLADKLHAVVEAPERLETFSKRLPVVKGVEEHAAEMEEIYHELVQ
jgi:glycosyltransferase involved in cell wall biosynthesis